MVRTADGQDGEDGSKITIGENGHWYIDGEDTFYIAGERDVIEVDVSGEAYVENQPLPIQFRNVPQTQHELDMENVTIDLNDEGEIDEMFLQTSDIEDVFAFYDMACRGFDPDINGLLLLPDATGLKGISTTYKVVQYLKRDETLYKKFIFNYELEGVIQLDEVVYAFSVVIQPVAINEEQFYKTNLTNPGYEDTFVRYICADGDKIITQPCQYMAESGIWRNPHNTSTSIGGGIYYPKTEGNPYAEDMPKLAMSIYQEKEYYFYQIGFTFYDGQVMTDEEVFRSVKSIMETLQNSFVVYDYEHYKHQFDNEAEV